MHGQYEKLMHELTTEDQSGLKNFLRVDPDIFMELLHRVGPRIEKQDTCFRKALPPELKLAVTLRYLDTGDSYKSLSDTVRILRGSRRIEHPLRSAASVRRRERGLTETTYAPVSVHFRMLETIFISIGRKKYHLTFYIFAFSFF